MSCLAASGADDEYATRGSHEEVEWRPCAAVVATPFFLLGVVRHPATLRTRLSASEKTPSP